MIEYIQKMIELAAQKRWLKEIERQLNEVNRAIGKVRQAEQNVNRNKFVLKKLIDEYNSRFQECLEVKEKANG